MGRPHRGKRSGEEEAEEAGKRKNQAKAWKMLVPKERLELSRDFSHHPLKMACLPVPPLRLKIKEPCGQEPTAGP